VQTIVLLTTAFIAGAAVAAIAVRVRLAELRARAAQAEAAHANLSTQLRYEQQASADKIALLSDAKQQLADSFKALSAEALQTNNRSFLELAQSTLQRFQEGARGDLERRHQAIGELVKPVRESLDKVDGRIVELERARTGAYAALVQQVKSLQTTQTELRSETGNLVKALRSPSARGRWGEVQLRRVVEMAGMLNHCDFLEQQSVTTDDGRLRPDLIVKLPGGKNVVIDAKVPLMAYMEAIEAPDEDARLECMVRHARHVRDHMKALSRKTYWEQFQ